MINKLIPEQISNFWNVIKYAIEQSLPPFVGDNEDRMNRILTSCLCGQAEVWLIYEKDNEKVNFKGVVLTRIIIDDVSATRSLLIYSLFGYDSLNNKIYLDGLKSLWDYAKSKKCVNIVAHTPHLEIANLAKSLGGEINYFITFKSIQKM